MNQLLLANRRQEYKSGPAGRGFLCRVVEGGMTRVLRLRGVTKLIKQKIRKPRNTARTLRLFTLTPGYAPVFNTKATGKTVHQHLQHSVMCVRSGDPCQCLRLYGAPTPPLHRQTTSVQDCVRAANLFVTEYGLVPLAGEVIVRHATLGVGTQIDALFRSRQTIAAHGSGDRSPVVLVSWKSGAGPRDPVELERHRAQVAFEWSALATTHQVRVECAYIVYVTSGKHRSSQHREGFYFVEPVPAEDISALVARLAPSARQLAAVAAKRK